jgi:hypothetical protein
MVHDSHYDTAFFICVSYGKIVLTAAEHSAMRPIFSLVQVIVVYANQSASLNHHASTHTENL